MKFRNKALILFLLIIAMIYVYRQPKSAFEPPEALEAMLATTGAVIVEGEVQYFASLGQTFLAMDELEEMLFNVADRLALRGGTVQRSEGETYRVLDVTGETSLGPQAHIVVQSNPGDGSLSISPQSYLLVVCRDTSVTRVKTVASRLDVLLQPLAPGGQLSYYLTGELAGRHTLKEMQKLAEDALAAVDGRVIEGLEDEEMISLTAYTPRLGSYLTADEDRFNLNLAVRYDSYLDKTVLWAGFPIIHDTY